MASAKKPSVKWNLPEDTENVQTPRSSHSYSDTSEKYVYTDTFEDQSQSYKTQEMLLNESQPSYSDTFMTGTVQSTIIKTDTHISEATFDESPSESQSSYSDTFITGTIQSVVPKTETHISEVIDVETHISETIETHISEFLGGDSHVSETVGDTHISEAAGLSHISEALSDTHISEALPDTVRSVHDTVIETAYDVSESHAHSYTETFDSSAAQTRADNSDDKSYTETFQSFPESEDVSSPYTQKDTSRRSTDDETTEQSYTESYYSSHSRSETYEPSEEVSASLLDEDYTDTFEATEPTTITQPVDPEVLRREQELQRLTEEAQHTFVVRLLQRMKDKPHRERQRAKLRLAEERVVKQTEEPVNEDMARYCKKKIKLIKKKEKYGERPAKKRRSPVHEPKLISDYGLSQGMIERMKIRNVLMRMEIAAKAGVHDPNTCAKCKAKKDWFKEDEARRLFISSKTRHIQHNMMDHKVEDYLLKMNSVSMIADLARSLPKASEKPEVIMDKLNEPLHGKNVMR